MVTVRQHLANMHLELHKYTRGAFKSHKIVNWFIVE